MAKDVTRNPWIFDAAGDTEGVANAADSSQTPNFDGITIWVEQIKLDTGDGGDFLLSESDSGKRILKLDNTPANDTLWVPMHVRVRGVFVSTLATNATLEIYHGDPNA